MESLSFLFIPLSLLATAVMAGSAALQAHRVQMDPFGATVLAIATSMGGGSLRDLFLGNTPVFWITDSRYFMVAVPVALISFALATRMSAGKGSRLRILMRLDAIGLALFTLTGVQVALDAGISPLLAVVLGCVTGTAGGMIRDLLCNMTPSLLKEDLYATISLLGGALYLLCLNHLSEPVAAGISFIAILIARLAFLQLKPPRDTQ